MTFQISRRGKEYLETAQTLLRAANSPGIPGSFQPQRELQWNEWLAVRVANAATPLIASKGRAGNHRDSRRHFINF